METIDDILREMRDNKEKNIAIIMLQEYVIIIEDAYSRDRACNESKSAENEELARKLTKQREINKELVDEIASIRRDLAEAVHESCSNCYHNKPDDPWCDGCAVASWKETLERKEAENEDR